MGKLKNKLGRLQMGAALAGGAPRQSAARDAAEAARLQRVRAALQELQGRRAPPPEPVAPSMPLPGGEHLTEHGPIYLVACDHPIDHAHGTVPLAGCLRATGEHLATLSLDPELAQLDMTRLLFLDTETTGLAGGAGTVPFLVGLTFLQEGRWRTEQLLLRQPGDEEPLLRHLAQRLSEASALVTYNGKCFDWPLLKTRFVLNRLPAPPQLPHLDLLHCARRVLRRRPGPLRLANIEQDLLGFHREGDIDGAAIPATYFAFLRGAPAHVLTPIIVHNAHDLLAMVALLGVLAERLDAPHQVDAAGCLSLAELRLRAGQAQGAALLAKAAAAADDALTAVDAYLLMARLAKRQGQHADAAESLHAALAVGDIDANRYGDLHLGLAKLYEHRLRDLPRALHHAQQSAAAEAAGANARRLARLQAKAFALRLRQDTEAQSPV